MRHIIATTKFKHELYQFTEGNLRQLANFESLPITLLGEDRVIGTANKPKLSDDGTVLTAELTVTEIPYLDATFSVGYRILEEAMSLERDDMLVSRLQIHTIFPTPVDIHD